MSEAILMDLVERVRGRFYGKYRGTVTKIGTAGDGGLGRIKALVPAVLGDQESGWCMPCVPYAGKKAGFAFLPEKDAGVWIEFEGGDVSYPIWVGCYWHDGDVPDAVAPDVKVIRTPGENQLVMSDKDHKIEITDKSKNSATLDQDGIAMARGSGKVAIADGKVKVNDGAMEVT